MFRFIISLILCISFFTGCERRNNFEDVIKKLKAENKLYEKNTTSAQKIIPHKKEKIQLPKVEVKQETLINKEKPQHRKKVTNLTLKSVSGKKLNLKFLEEGITFSQYKNKVVILDVFTTWCPPCIKSIPHLIQLQKKYKKDIQIIGILMEENKKNSEVSDFIKKHNINYPITNCKENFTLADTWGGISGYPTIIIFDKNGTYFNHFNGAPPIEMLESDIKKVLKK